MGTNTEILPYHPNPVPDDPELLSRYLDDELHRLSQYLILLVEKNNL